MRLDTHPTFVLDSGHDPARKRDSMAQTNEYKRAYKLGTALFQCYLPRAQCALVLFNANAGNQNLEFFLTIAEQTTS